MKRRLELEDKIAPPIIFDFYCKDGKIRHPDESKGKYPIAICVSVNLTEAVFMSTTHVDDVCWSPSQSGTICSNSSNGESNTNAITKRSDYSQVNYPAFFACVNMITVYPKLDWYMPSINEIASLFVSKRSSIRDAFSSAGVSSNIIFDQQPRTNDIRYLASTDGYAGNVRQCHAYSMSSFSDEGRWKYAINDNYAGTYSFSKVIPFAKIKLS